MMCLQETITHLHTYRMVQKTGRWSLLIKKVAHVTHISKGNVATVRCDGIVDDDCYNFAAEFSGIKQKSVNVLAKLLARIQ